MDVLRNTQKNLMSGQEKLEGFEEAMTEEMVAISEVDSIALALV